MTSASHSHYYVAATNEWVSYDDGSRISADPPETGGLYVSIDIAGNDQRGYSVPQHYDLMTDLFDGSPKGLGRRQKIFDGNAGLQVAVNNYKASGLQDGPEVNPILCFKSFNTTQVNNRLDELTANESWTYFQEYPKFLQDGTLTMSSYNAAHTALKNLIDAHDNGHFVKIASNSAWYQERQNGPFWQGVDLDVVDEIGMDTYSNGSRAKPWTGPQLFAILHDWLDAASTSHPNITAWAPEWGVARYVSNTIPLNPATRLAALVDHVETARSYGFSGLNYWAVDNGNATGDWSIDKAGDEDIVDYFYSKINESPA